MKIVSIKRGVAALLAAVMLGLCGCGAAQQTPPAPSDPAASAPAQTPQAAPAQPSDAQPPAQPPDPVQTTLEGMTLQEKLYQLFVVTPEALTGVALVTQAGEATRAALLEKPVGGLIYYAANLETREQVTSMLQNSQDASAHGLFLSVDEEGGLVARVGSNQVLGTTAFPAMAEIADDDAAYAVGSTIGSELKALGFNLDFAPVADVNSNPENPVIGTRAFSTDAKTCAARVAACVRGFSDAGMICTLKHFPGHGDTQTDSHAGLALTEKTLEQLEQLEFLPFAAGIAAGADMVMVGHITAPNITGSDEPATMSEQMMTEILRGELGFSGVVVSDAMNMGAITTAYSSAEAACGFLKAGGDLMVAPESFDEAYAGLLEAVQRGEIPESRIDESVTRILTLKQTYGILK